VNRGVQRRCISPGRENANPFHRVRRPF
jgi:hypothetical protein